MPAPRKPMAAKDGCHLMTQETWSFREEYNRNTGVSLGGYCNFKRSRKALHNFFQAGYFCLRGKGFSEDNGCTGGTVGMTRKGTVKYL